MTIDDTAICLACDGSGSGAGDTQCGFCGGCGGVPMAAAQQFASDNRGAETPDRTPLIGSLERASGRLACIPVMGLAVGEKPYVILHALDRDVLCDLLAEAARVIKKDQTP